MTDEKIDYTDPQWWAPVFKATGPDLPPELIQARHAMIREAYAAGLPILTIARLSGRTREYIRRALHEKL